MSFVTPTEKGSLSIGKLFKNFFVPPTMFPNSVEHVASRSMRPEQDIKKSSSLGVETAQTTREVLNGAFLQTFGFDSYDPTSNTYTTAYGTKMTYNSRSFSLALAFTSFFGIPNRPNTFREDGAPVLSFKQAAKDWIGGWNPLYYQAPPQEIPVNKIETTYTPPPTELPDGSDGTLEFSDAQVKAITTELSTPLTPPELKTPLEKKIVHSPKEWFLNAKTLLQIPALLIKFLIILPIKLITWPFKIALNIVKLFTEFLPLFVANVSAQQIGKLAAEINIIKRPAETAIPFDSSPSSDAEPLLGHSEEPSKPSIIWPILWRGALIGLLGIAHYTTRVISLVGRALTSPEISARMAFTYGRGLKITTSSTKERSSRRSRFTVSDVFGFILGSVGAVMSLALSATLWAITLPLAIGTLLSFIPQALPLLNWFAQLPVVAASLSTMGTTFGTVATLVSNAIGSAFAPAITALSALIPGLVVSTQAIAVGTTLGIIFAPIASILSRVANVLSDLWANWNPKDNKTLNNAVREALGMSPKDVYAELGVTPTHSATLTHAPSPTVQQVVCKAADDALRASKAVQSTSAFSQSLELSHDRGCGQVKEALQTTTPEAEIPTSFAYTGGQ